MRTLIAIITLVLCAAIAQAQIPPTTVISSNDTTKGTVFGMSALDVVQIGADQRGTLYISLESATATDWIAVALNNDTSATKVIYHYGGKQPIRIDNVRVDSVKVKGNATGKRRLIHFAKP